MKLVLNRETRYKPQLERSYSLAHHLVEIVVLENCLKYLTLHKCIVLKYIYVCILYIFQIFFGAS